ncbi:hypothetical protein B7P43_G16685 [Cryptotermes secundus]|uniref:Uncharacterized protein n=1 Tax=Cryptotermes secundus TaxID=105785 RepID=A0A2J7PGQ6_9NEOP|nr:hypothetical protein B7P43_G16685 [Cryptotermes secundus]
MTGVSRGKVIKKMTQLEELSFDSFFDSSFDQSIPIDLSMYLSVQYLVSSQPEAKRARAMVVPEQWFSLALDESTDITDTAQLLLFIRGVNADFEVTEELASMNSLRGTTTGEDIFKEVEEMLTKYNLKWNQLKCVTTDGGKNMSGTEPVVSTVNFIRSRGLNHRQFGDFLSEVEAEYPDLPYHTAVRWLSSGKILLRFFELRAEIEIFLNEKKRPQPLLSNTEWLWKLAFAADIMGFLNGFNLKLQGRERVSSCNSVLRPLFQLNGSLVGYIKVTQLTDVSAGNRMPDLR